jgi:hypothetical protein
VDLGEDFLLPSVEGRDELRERSHRRLQVLQEARQVLGLQDFPPLLFQTGVKEEQTGRVLGAVGYVVDLLQQVEDVLPDSPEESPLGDLQAQVPVDTVRPRLLLEDFLDELHGRTCVPSGCGPDRIGECVYSLLDCFEVPAYPFQNRLFLSVK